MNIQSFLKKAYSKQVKTTGSEMLYSERGQNAEQSITGVLTEKSGFLTVEEGGTVYTIAAHLLTDYPVKAGAKIKQGDVEYLVLSSVHSPTDATYSSDLAFY